MKTHRWCFVCIMYKRSIFIRTNVVSVVCLCGDLVDVMECYRWIYLQFECICEEMKIFACKQPAGSASASRGLAQSSWERTEEDGNALRFYVCVLKPQDCHVSMVQSFIQTQAYFPLCFRFRISRTGSDVLCVAQLQISQLLKGSDWGVQRRWSENTIIKAATDTRQ